MDKRNTRNERVTTGVGVLDRAVGVLDALELGPASLADLVAITKLTRPTAHRLTTALEAHGFVARDVQGRFVLGSRPAELAAAAAASGLAFVARPVLVELRDACDESAQLFRREGDHRVCDAVADLDAGLRDTVPVGSSLPLTAGSAAQVLLAWSNPDDAAAHLAEATFDPDQLDTVREQGWAASVEERREGVASVSAPVRAPSGTVVAAVSVSGPIARLGTHPGFRYATAVVEHARKLERLTFIDA